MSYLITIPDIYSPTSPVPMETHQDHQRKSKRFLKKPTALSNLLSFISNPLPTPPTPPSTTKLVKGHYRTHSSLASSPSYQTFSSPLTPLSSLSSSTELTPTSVNAFHLSKLQKQSAIAKGENAGRLAGKLGVVKGKGGETVQGRVEVVRTPEDARKGTMRRMSNILGKSDISQIKHIKRLSPELPIMEESDRWYGNDGIIRIPSSTSSNFFHAFRTFNIVFPGVKVGRPSLFSPQCFCFTGADQTRKKC